MPRLGPPSHTQGIQLPYPENLDHHFAVDRVKFDFYAMDCYRQVGEDKLAEVYSHEVIRSSTDPDGTERKPMRNAEARIALGVAAARAGELDQAVSYGRQSIDGDRKSLPSLVICSRELGDLLHWRYPNEPETAAYLEQVRALIAP